MDVQKALDIKKALITLSEALDIEITDLPARISFFNDEKFAMFVEAQKTWVAFYEADIVDRGAMLGIEITTETNGSHSCSVEL